MAVSAIANTLVSRYLKRVARAYDSVALEADAAHLSTDVWTSLGVLGGLLAVRLTGLTILDPIIAIAVALLIMKAAYDITRKSFGGLIDKRLPQKEEAIIVASIAEHVRDDVSFHELRTRKAGSIRYIELHLMMNKHTSLKTTHQMCDHLEADIKSKLPSAIITIHCEPREEGCISLSGN